MGKNELKSNITIPFFVKIDGLSKLENEKKWFEAIDLLKINILKHPNDKRYVYRLEAELFYILSNWIFYSIGNIDIYTEIKKEFINIYNKLNEELENNNDFNFIFGYFMSMFPDFFAFNSDNENDYINKGKGMLKKAYLNDSNNILFEYFYRGSIEIDDRYIKCKNELKKISHLIFPKESKIEIYFNEMINI